MIGKNTNYQLQLSRDRIISKAFTFAVLMHILLGFFLYHGIHWQYSTVPNTETELWSEVSDILTIPQKELLPLMPAISVLQVSNEETNIALRETKRKQKKLAPATQLVKQQRLKLQQQQEGKIRHQQKFVADRATTHVVKKSTKLKPQHEQSIVEKRKQKKLTGQSWQKKLQQKIDEGRQMQMKKFDEERRTRIAQMQDMINSNEGFAKNDTTGYRSNSTVASPSYADKVRRRVRPNIVWSGEIQHLETVITVRCAPIGTLLSATVTRSSGNSQWDDAALRAVQRSDPMPLDTTGKAPASFMITLRPATN